MVAFGTPGKAGQGRASQGKPGQGRARHGTALQDTSSSFVPSRVLAWQSHAIRQGLECLGL
eukprot:4315141-Alexandrium_andersonii.AAC.1